MSFAEAPCLEPWAATLGVRRGEQRERGTSGRCLPSPALPGSAGLWERSTPVSPQYDAGIPASLGSRLQVEPPVTGKTTLPGGVPLPGTLRRDQFVTEFPQ